MSRINDIRMMLLPAVLFTAACSGEFATSPTSPTEIPVAGLILPNNEAEPGHMDVYVSDLPWTSAINGWGFAERDRSNGERSSSDGRTITLNGQTYAKGIGAHANSEIVFETNGSCVRFAAEIGVDDEVDAFGPASIVFEVWADGRRLFESERMTGASLTEAAKVDITGAREIRLVITSAGDGIDFDHGDWANARILCPRPDAK